MLFFSVHQNLSLPPLPQTTLLAGQDQNLSLPFLKQPSLQDKVLKQGPNLEIVRGDVFQYATLPKALGDANVVIVATGAADPLDPLGPFNVDYQVRQQWMELFPGACG